MLIYGVNEISMIMLFNLLSRKTVNPLSGCSLPVTDSANTRAEVTGFFAGAARAHEIQQPAELNRLKENSISGYDLSSVHKRGCCGFSTGIDVDIQPSQQVQ